ncbi:hypothetical protein BFW86_09365 [Pseudomonas fluorescens]|nr:hypothetical protein BFW86_09365 [Pseudomonas fluorescens]
MVQVPLLQPYHFHYIKGRDYHLHGAAAGMLYTQILDCPIPDWLSGFVFTHRPADALFLFVLRVWIVNEIPPTSRKLRRYRPYLKYPI